MIPYGDYQVSKVEETRSSYGTELWRVSQIRPDNAIHCHVFPKTTMASRAAEYGIDPTDTSTLLDIVLHEPFMVNPLDQLYDENEDPVVKAGLKGVSKVAIQNMRTGKMILPGEEMPAWCYNTDEATARTAHLLRLKHCKENRVRVVDSKRITEIIKHQSPIVTEEISALRVRVNKYRNGEPVIDSSRIAPVRDIVKPLRPERIARNGRLI